MRVRDAIREAKTRGTSAGRSAASWIELDDDAKAGLWDAMQDGGDTERYVETPAWLSGEWAGESPAEILGDVLDEVRDEDAHDEILQAYEDAADAAFWAEVERIVTPSVPARTFDGVYRVRMFPGVAVRVVAHNRYDDSVSVVMIGDDRAHTGIDPDDLVPLRSSEFCTECGQVGCAHGAEPSDD